MPRAQKCDWQSYRLLFVVMSSFFVGGICFISYLHTKPPAMLKTLMNYYYNDVYIGVDASELIKYDCNLRCSPYRRSNADKTDPNIDALQILKDVGINTVKMRLLHTHNEVYANLTNIIKTATRIYQQNMWFHLNISYSKTSPKASKWNDITIYDYTFAILSKLNKLSILPHIVSIDSDIIDIEALLLLQSAINAIRNVSQYIQIMVHIPIPITTSNSNSKLKDMEFIFTKQLQLFDKCHVEFDIVGISGLIFEAFDCKESNYEPIITNILNVFANGQRGNVRLMITQLQFANHNLKCFEVLMNMANSKRLKKFVGVELLDGIDFQHIALFDKKGVLLPELRKISENNTKPRKLNWAYLLLLLTVIFLIGIGCNYCFWNKSRRQQQIQLTAIIKKG